MPQPRRHRHRGRPRTSIRRHTQRIDEFAELDIRKQVVSVPPAWRRLDILLAMPLSTSLRLDGLLAAELPASRSRLAAMHGDWLLRTVPGGAAVLRRQIRDGTRILLDLAGEVDLGTTWRLAAGGPP